MGVDFALAAATGHSTFFGVAWALVIVVGAASAAFTFGAGGARRGAGFFDDDLAKTAS
jgi:hypothetical protein